MNKVPEDYFDDISTTELCHLWRKSIPSESIILHEERIIAHLETSLSGITQKAPSEHIFLSISSLSSLERTSLMTTLLAILQDRKRFVQSILSNGAPLRGMALALAAISTLAFGMYGFVLGVQHSLWQAFSAAAKLPLLFMLTIIITFPTLFIFGSLIGINRTFMQTVVVLLAGTTIISLALVALSPVTLLFGMTTSSYPFFKLLNVGIFIVAWFLGAAFFRAVYAPIVQARQQIQDDNNDWENRPAASIDEASRFSAQSRVLSEEQAENHTKVQSYFIRFWFLLYGFVAVQIAWMLRPFVCSSSMEFQFLRGMRDNVYGDILYSIAHILGFR